MLRIDSSGIKAAIAFDSDDSPRPCLAGHPDVYPDESPEVGWDREYDPEPTTMDPIEPWQAWEAMALAVELKRPDQAARFALDLRDWVRRALASDGREKASILDVLHPIDRNRTDRYRRAHKRVAAWAKVLAGEGVAA